MVRVVSSGFSTPRSRHSSGEDMIDRFAAMKALSALNDEERLYMYRERLGSGGLPIDSNTDTNDSFSGVDSEEDVRMRSAEKEIGDKHLNQDPIVVKKARRKERNKISAQNYRQRRRQQASTAQRSLDSLETHHKELLEKVRQLEAEKHIVEEYLKNCVKIPWCPHHQLPRPPNPPPHPPTIPENVPVTNVCSSDHVTMQTVTQNVNIDACANVNSINFPTHNARFAITSFTAPLTTSAPVESNNNNNKNINVQGNKLPVPMNAFPCTNMMGSGNGNVDSMPVRMTEISSQLSSGSSVS